MGPAILAGILFALLIVFIHKQKTQEQRKLRQKDLPCEDLLPRHYKSFTAVENELWRVTEGVRRTGEWDEFRLGNKQCEFEILNDYLHRLHADFRQGHRIFGQVIIHSPEIELLARLETERLRLEASFYLSYSFAWFRLRTAGISIKELRHLTDVVATLAHRISLILSALEDSQQLDILKNS